MEKRLRNPLEVPTEVSGRHKYQFFKSKVKEFINYHLDFAKYDKKIITEDDLGQIKKLETEETIPKPSTKKIKPIEPEPNSEFKQLRENLLLKISNIEKINTLFKSAHRIYESLEKTDKKDLILSKLSNSNQIYLTIQEILNKELDNFHTILMLLDNYDQKMTLELSKLRKSLTSAHRDEVETIKEKFELKIKALVQHNKALSSRENESKLHQVYKNKIESLETLLFASNAQISEKNEAIKQKNSEVSSLKLVIERQKEEFDRVYKEKKDLESLVTVQQESYHGQVIDLTSEVARLKNTSQEFQLSKQLEISEHKFIAESSKNRLDQALQELKNTEDQLKYEKSRSRDNEAILSAEINDLKVEIERLDRIVFNLKQDLDQSPQGLDLETLKNSQRKDEEIEYLNTVINKLQIESSELLNHNRDLFTQNQRLESRVLKVKEKQSLKSSKSEKKIKKK